MSLIDCQTIANNWINELKREVAQRQIKPSLKIIQVGNDYASGVYIRNKLKVAKEIGINARHITFPENISFDELQWEIVKLERIEAEATMIQLPVPKHLRNIEQFIEPREDVDGLTTENLGKLFVGDRSGFIPCTAKGIMKILEPYDLAGKNAVVVGRSNIVGKPVAHLLLEKDCTVTICHSKTKHLEEHTKNADIVISAIGKPHYFNSWDFAEGAIVIDVGINRNPENGKICGDVNPSVAEYCYLTPVPKGVGLLTVAALMDNVLRV